MKVYPYELLFTGLLHVLEEKDIGIIIKSELTVAHIGETEDRKPNAWPHKEELHPMRGRDCQSIA